MTNRYYRKFEIIDGQYYGPPAWIRKDFGQIKSREIKFQDGDRLDIIAEQVYGDANLWKAIALYNGIGYMFDIQPGDNLYLPLSISEVVDKM
jgi:nucleoid-associated protein YgaU